MRAWFFLLLAAPVLASPEEADPEAACRAHLQKLGGAVRAYRLIHDGKDPAKLSDLYNESLVESLGDFACPASGTKIVAGNEIDAKSDYTLQPLPGTKDMLVREKTARHPSGMLAGFADGSIKVVGAPASAPAAASAAAPASAPAPAPAPAETAETEKPAAPPGEAPPAAPSAETAPQMSPDPDATPTPANRPGGFAPVVGPNAFADPSAAPPSPVPTPTNLQNRGSRTVWIAGGVALLVLIIAMASRKRPPAA